MLGKLWDDALKLCYFFRKCLHTVWTPCEFFESIWTFLEQLLHCCLFGNDWKTQTQYKWTMLKQIRKQETIEEIQNSNRKLLGNHCCFLKQVQTHQDNPRHFHFVRAIRLLIVYTYIYMIIYTLMSPLQGPHQPYIAF